VRPDLDHAAIYIAIFFPQSAAPLLAKCHGRGRGARAHSLFQPEIRRFTLKNQNGVVLDLIGVFARKKFNRQPDQCWHAGCSKAFVIAAGGDSRGSHDECAMVREPIGGSI
jgi:hypothetical protein